MPSPLSLIHFTRGRLCIGFRKKDWTPVWAMKDSEDGDGTASLIIYKVSTKGQTPREPMLAEVIWLPHFFPDAFDANDSKARKKLQMQFIGDACKYLEENDPEVVRQLEEDLHYPGYRKWQTWFEEAKKYKRVQMRERAARRIKRKAAAREQARLTGRPFEEIEWDSESSINEDSGFEEDTPVVQRRRKTKRNARMPPPPRPAPGGRKRKDSGNDSDGPKSKKKPTSKSRRKGKQNEDLPLPEESTLFVSQKPGQVNFYDGGDYLRGRFDGLGAFANPRPSPMSGRSASQGPIVDLTDDENDGDFDDDNSLFDSRAPEGPSQVGAPSRADQDAFNLFPTPQATADQYGTTGPGEAPPSRRAYTSVSPHGDFGNGLSGHGARMMAARRSKSRTGSNAGVNETARPAQPPLVRSLREGSVIEDLEVENGGLDDEAALAAALRASQAPESEQEREDAAFAEAMRLSQLGETEEERLRRATHESVEREEREAVATREGENDADDEEAEPGADAGDD